MIISIIADSDRGTALGASAVMQKPISRQDLYHSLIDLGLLPPSEDEPLKVLVADVNADAVERIAVRMGELPVTLLRAYGGREAIELAQRELPQLIVLDLMMPDVNGFDVVDALQSNPATADIPIVVLTEKHITEADRDRLNGFVATILPKTGLNGARFTAEVRRAMSGRTVGV